MSNNDHLIDDRRLQLNSGNMFRKCRQNGLPKMAQGVTGCISLRTSQEIQIERVASKRALAV